MAMANALGSGAPHYPCLCQDFARSTVMPKCNGLGTPGLAMREASRAGTVDVRWKEGTSSTFGHCSRRASTVWFPVVMVCHVVGLHKVQVMFLLLFCTLFVISGCDVVSCLLACVLSC